MDERPASRTDWAIEQIRRVILFGDLRPGDRLVSSAWSKRLGVSQTPLREAFQRLAAEGLVLYDPQRGARVAPLTLRDACEIYQLRITLEPRAVESSVAAATAVWRSELTTAFRRIDRAYAGRAADRSGAVEAHRAFHQALRANCQSQWLLRMTSTLADQSTRAQFASIGPRGGRHTARAEHQDLYAAAAAGDSARSAELTAEHLHRTLEALTTASSFASSVAG